MKKYDYIFFDLDGTLSDSAPGIVNSVTYALNRMGIDVADKEPLKKFVGPPLVESFSMYYNFTPDQIERAVMLFREYFEAQGISENCMYAGADILLEKLKYVGKIPVIATSKPEPFAKIILSRYGIDHYFHYIAGSTTDETRTKKDEVIAYALEACKIDDSSRVVMVGDRSHDVIGAKKNGIDCIGVLYGYGERKELEDAGAICTVKDFDELARIII